MKKILFYSLSLLFIIPLHAQNDDDTPKKKPGALEGMVSHSYTAAGMSYYFLPLASLNAQLSDMGIKTGFANAIGLGLDHGSKTVTTKFSRGFTGMTSFHYLLPQHLSTSNDSLKFALNGYNAQFDLAGGNWLKSDIFTLTGGLGWMFGRLKVTEETAKGKTTFTNPYFAPQLRLEFNVRLFNHLTIGVRYAYRKDWTRSGWNVSGADAPMIGGTSLSGTMLGAFIGYSK